MLKKKYGVALLRRRNNRTELEYFIIYSKQFYRYYLPSATVVLLNSYSEKQEVGLVMIASFVVTYRRHQRLS